MPPIPANLRSIFAVAGDYDMVSRALAQHCIPHGDHRPRYIGPMVMCAAFSAELYLKCLIAEYTSDRGLPQEHDLYLLFHQLPREIKYKLRKLHDNDAHVIQLRDGIAAVGGKPESALLDGTLSAGRCLFEDWRYRYEMSETPLLNDLGHLRRILRSYILTLHPEWEQEGTHFQPTFRGP